MAAAFVVVPQWQASGSSRAMRLVDGAEAIRGDLPSASTSTVDVPLEAGDAQGSGVHRMSSLALVRDRLAQTLSGLDGPVITIGGDCGVELGAIGHVTASRSDVAVVWFDAHPDLNTAESSPSGNFNGMVLRAVLGDGVESLRPPVPLSAQRLVLVGTRAFDAPEEEFIAERGIPVLDGGDPAALVAAVAATGATSVYLHVDLDVLDPGEFSGLDYPEPFGLTAVALVDLVRALLDRFELAGAGITEFSPASPDSAVEDLPTILRIVGALTR
jgi:arginase